MKKCKLCKVRPAIEDHHFWFGNGTRQIADEYGLIIPLCRVCHNEAHRHKKPIQKKICDVLLLDYVNLNQIMKRPKKKWNKFQKDYMEIIRDSLARRKKLEEEDD